MLARRGDRVVAEFGNCNSVQVRSRGGRIEVDRDQISRIVPLDILRTVDPFQGCRDRIRSPHSRGARLGFHQTLYLKGNLGEAVMRGRFAMFHVVTA